MIVLTCKQACDNATDYLESLESLEHLERDRQIKPHDFWQRLFMRFHLIICRDCRNYFDQFRVAIGVAQKLGVKTPDTSDQDIENLIERLKVQRKM